MSLVQHSEDLPLQQKNIKKNQAIGESDRICINDIIDINYINLFSDEEIEKLLDRLSNINI